jgi:hypothetical protein
MPRRDGTGPLGAGAMTGRGFGSCPGTDAVKYGAGLGLGFGLGLARRRGFGRWFGRSFTTDEISPKTRKELLQNQKSILEKRLEVIEKQLEDL